MHKNVVNLIGSVINENGYLRTIDNVGLYGNLPLLINSPKNQGLFFKFNVHGKLSPLTICLKECQYDGVSV